MSEDTTSMANSLLAVSELVTPYFEMGKGMRVQLEADGWSPTIAEALAAEAVIQIMKMAAAPVINGTVTQ